MFVDDDFVPFTAQWGILSSLRRISLDELEEHVADALRQLLKVNDVQLELTDEREAGEAIDLKFAGELTGSQEKAVEAMLRHASGARCAA